MDDPDFTPDSAPFKACLKVAQTPGEAVQFCVLLDSSGSAPVIGLHRRKDGKVLFTAAKKTDKSLIKGTWGTATLDDKQLVLNCEKKVSGLVKACKIWAKASKSPFIKRVIPMVDGQVLEEDQDELAAPAPSAAEMSSPAETLAAPQAPGPSDDAHQPDEERQLYHALVQSVKSCKGLLPAATLEAAAKTAQAALKSGDFRTAAAVISSLRKKSAEQAAMGGAEDSSTSPASGDGSGAMVDYTRFKTLGEQWQKLRDTGLKQSGAVAKLMLMEHPDSTAQARQIAGLYTAFDRKLAICLAQLATDLPEGTREKLTSATKETVKRYRKILRSDPLFHHMAQNPYVQMDPQGEMGPTLEEIEAALAG